MSESLRYRVLRKSFIRPSGRVTQAVKSQLRLSTVNESLLLLGELASELSTTLNFEDLQSVLSHKLRWIVDFDQCTLTVWPDSSNTEYLLFELTSPSRSKTTPLQKVPLDEGWPGKVLVEAKPFMLSELTQLPRSITPPKNPHWGIDLNARSLMLLPLRTGERTIGSLNFSSSKSGNYTAAWHNVSSLLTTQVGGQLSSILAHQQTALALEALKLSQTQLKSAMESREQMIAQLEAQMSELQRLNRLKDEFLNAIADELRAPLANIKMAIHMLKVAASAKRTDHYLQILEDECTRETNLISDLLDLHRLEAGSRPVIPEAIYVKDWLAIVVESFRGQLKERQQVLQLDTSHALAPLVSDRSSLERILSELINNACKYTPQGGKIRVCARQYSNDSKVLMTEFMVLNSGSEIPTAELNRIFERFYRIRRDDPWGHKGTGLGLALVRKLAEQLNGMVGVYSRSGQTTFTVQVPCLLPDIH